jgi:glycosyltransferase involved in cell wall biosynthesis
MRVLLVCSGNKGGASPFISEQAAQLVDVGCFVELFLIRGKGWKGYLKNRSALLAKIQEFQPEIVHAHSGMSALLAGMQRVVPVVATFHGSDVHVPKLRAFTRVAVWLSRAHITVSAEMKRILGKDSVHIIPCAVDTSVFFPADRELARYALGWSLNDKYVLFSSAFDNHVKNAPLAMEAVAALENPKVKLMELKGRSRLEVAHMMNACDVALMTSFNEGSSQFVKEALACGTPLVSTRVGIVAELSADIQGLYIVNYNSSEIARALRLAIQFREFHRSTSGPIIIQQSGLTPLAVSNKLMAVYKSVIDG